MMSDDIQFAPTLDYDDELRKRITSFNVTSVPLKVFILHERKIIAVIDSGLQYGYLLESLLSRIGL